MLRGVDRATAKARANDLLAAMDLTESANILVQDYSAGMTKKIALGTALIHSPKILILDEPFEAVDPVSAANIRQILRGYAQSGGTVIISSHVMALVEQLCDHVAIISDGSILAAGTTAEVSGGMSLEDRFLSLVGGLHESDNLGWLSQNNPAATAAAQHPQGGQPMQPIQPIQPTLPAKDGQPPYARPSNPAQPLGPQA